VPIVGADHRCRSSVPNSDLFNQTPNNQKHAIN
jgi:hypothetical protein